MDKDNIKNLAYKILNAQDCNAFRMMKMIHITVIQ